jgi:hypothetical protein
MVLRRNAGELPQHASCRALREYSVNVFAPRPLMNSSAVAVRLNQWPIEALNVDAHTLSAGSDLHGRKHACAVRSQTDNLHGTNEDAR